MTLLRSSYWTCTCGRVVDRESCPWCGAPQPRIDWLHVELRVVQLGMALGIAAALTVIILSLTGCKDRRVVPVEQPPKLDLPAPHPDATHPPSYWEPVGSAGATMTKLETP